MHTEILAPSYVGAYGLRAPATLLHTADTGAVYLIASTFGAHGECYRHTVAQVPWPAVVAALRAASGDVGAVMAASANGPLAWYLVDTAPMHLRAVAKAAHRMAAKFDAAFAATRSA